MYYLFSLDLPFILKIEFICHKHHRKFGMFTSFSDQDVNCIFIWSPSCKNKRKIWWSKRI